MKNIEIGATVTERAKDGNAISNTAIDSSDS
jgi:hypothetical protein